MVAQDACDLFDRHQGNKKLYSLESVLIVIFKEVNDPFNQKGYGKVEPCIDHLCKYCDQKVAFESL